MIDVVLAMLLQAAPQAPAAAPVQPPAAEEKKAPIKLICHREFETGSRVKTIKVCHSPEDPEQQEDKTALLRALDRQSDVAPPPSTFGN